MIKSLVVSILLMFSLAASAAGQMGTVISSSPNVQIIQNPIQTCNQVQSGYITHQPSGFNGGGIVGGVVGGAVGSLFGGGTGQLLSIVGGTIVGSYAGNTIYSANQSVIATPTYQTICQTSINQIEKIINYTTVIEYNGIRWVELYPAELRAGSRIWVNVNPTIR